MTATKVTSDRFKVSSLLAARLKEHGVSVPAVLSRAGLPSGLFQQEKIYVTTAGLFALWRAIGETSSDPAIGLKLGAEPRFERYQPTAIAAVCSRTRRELAHHYLRYSTVELNEAEFLLGYEDSNSFFRAFQGWEGTTPGEWRTRHRSAEPITVAAR